MLYVQLQRRLQVHLQQPVEESHRHDQPRQPAVQQHQFNVPRQRKVRQGHHQLRLHR